MRIAVAYTSLAAYHSLSIADLNKKEKEVMLWMVDGISRTRLEIADTTANGFDDACGLISQS